MRPIYFPLCSEFSSQEACKSLTAGTFQKLQNIIGAFSALPLSEHARQLPTGEWRMWEAEGSQQSLRERRPRRTTLTSLRFWVRVAYTPVSPNPGPICENKFSPHSTILGRLAITTQNFSPGQEVFFKYTLNPSRCRINIASGQASGRVGEGRWKKTAVTGLS